MLATLLVALVAIIHLAILVLEMFLWEAPAGRRAFNLSADFARQTRVLAANRGLYNGFLAAGGMGAVAGGAGGAGGYLFPACVLAAGIFGALTASRKILYIQALPALLALVAVLTQA
ncbi:membrane protein [Klebsiella pneumoniae]|nr:membrane protein [Klebsiella pneumoniae]